MRVIRLPLIALLTLPACEGMTNDLGLGGVAVNDFYFLPQSVEPAPDGTVTWTWQGTVQHNVTFENLPDSSGSQDAGTYTLSFAGAAPGSYRYRCTWHSQGYTGGMVGSVMVPQP